MDKVSSCLPTGNLKPIKQANTAFTGLVEGSVKTGNDLF